MDLIVSKNFKTLKGEVVVPSDKSISHRAVILASVVKGKSVIKNFSQAQDPNSSLEVCKKLGIIAEKQDNTLIINSSGKLSVPNSKLDCGNSGTTMRLISGILAGQDFNSELTGDESLSKRPMKRVIEPLELMGANIHSENFHAPLSIYGSRLSGINYSSKIASAQVKSCVLLAGLNAEGVTTFSEPSLSRNHTELMLKSMGADILVENLKVSVRKSELSPLNITICSDISSAAYFIVAGLVVPNAKIIIRNVGLNPTRTGIVKVAQQMGANIKILEKREICSEVVGDLEINYTPDLKGCEISGEIIPTLIDEIPVIALLATQAEGKTVIKDAQDLRNKESDRIRTTVSELQKLGANINETNDGMVIEGRTKLDGDCEVNSYQDHRLAMTLYVAGLICSKEILIKDFDWVKISFPNFVELFEKLKIS